MIQPMMMLEADKKKLKRTDLRRKEGIDWKGL
jgi:hypothetical protein